MRAVIVFFLTSVIVLECFGQVGIGTTTPDPSAKLDVSSTNSGFLPPRMTSAQRNLIINPSPGLIIFNTTTNNLEILVSSGWATINFSQPYIKKLFGGNNLEVARSILLTREGGYVIAGNARSLANGDMPFATHGLEDYWIIKVDGTGNIIWNKLFGGSGSDQAFKIQNTADGGYIIAGYSNSSGSGDVTGTNHGLQDYWIVKLDAGGNVEWNKLLGGNGNDYAQSILQTADSGYIILGYSTSSANGDVTDINHGAEDFWIVKLDSEGNIVWNKLLGGNSAEYAFSIQQTNDGGYIVAGLSNSSADGNVTDINQGPSDFWIVKLDVDGNIIWNKLLGGSGTEWAQSIQQTTDGGYIVAGFSTSSANGNVTPTSHGGYDYWIVKLNTTGTIIWNKLLGGNVLDQAYSIQQTSDGGYIVGGYSGSSSNGNVTTINHGLNDYWILKLDALGNITWNKLLGGNQNDQAYDIKETLDGGFVIAGFSNSSANGDVSGTNHGNGSGDFWIIKLDRNGNLY